jgi:colanic acid/amylovoran biosynthesis glycosyltransferase
MNRSPKKLAYITSMATGGLAGFNYRELTEMKLVGTEIVLFITKYISGPYMPPDGIPTYETKVVPIILSHPQSFFTRPIRYLSLLSEALSTKTVIDFAIAVAWSKIMVASGAEWLHCHWGDHKLYIGYYCHKLTGIPLSVTLHGYDLYNNPNWEMLEKSLKACAQIITISEYNRNLLIKRFGEIGKRVKVVRLSADLLDDPEKMKNTKNVLIVGGFHPRKGYDTLLQALRILDRDDIHLWVVGYNGPVDVRKMVADFGLQERVTILGQISDEVLKILYTFCDIFTMPSRIDHKGVGEGLPVALMEAMSYGKPVVSTYHTGIPELVPDILVEENDAQGLANGIALLADDRELRRKKGIRNREIIRNDYSNDNVRKLLGTFTIDR